MEDQAPITIGEFTRTMASIERQIASGFRGVHKRLDNVDNVTRDQGEAIATLEERTRQLKARDEKGDKQTRNRAVTWGGGVAGVLWLIEVARQYFQGAGN